METKKDEQEKKSVVKTEDTAGVRFTNMVIREFSTGGEVTKLSEFQKRLCQNYFIVADSVLRTSEEKRLKKPENKRDDLPFIWANVNMEMLARSVVGAARIGYDPSQKNHIHIIPYKNNTLKKYDLVLMEGYRGLELKAEKYGLDKPKDVIIEIVCANDEFFPLKKDKDNPVETYAFKIKTPFDRGDIVGGFYYYNFKDKEKNLLMFYTLAEIEKRKPEYASPEFWGGEKDVWKDGKKAGTEKVEGWFKEMVWKTLCRIAYGNITIDSKKIDDAFLIMQQQEQSFRSELPAANSEELKFEDVPAEDVTHQESTPAPEPEEKKQTEQTPAPDNKQPDSKPKGPGF